MNTLGLSTIMRMGCICTKEIIYVNGIKYRVIERIGEGGFSSIDLIENPTSKKKYALKRIVCHSIEDQRNALQEIEFCKKLRHPNIIELIDSTLKGSADIVVNTTSEICMVLPYFYRGTLHDLLDIRSQSNSHLTVEEILNMFKQICSAIKHMHECKPQALAHRDIKTSNICIGDDFSPVLMDLGSVAPAVVQVCGAQDAQKLQDLAAERCSMPYRAPELFNVESYCVIDQRTDIWSLGCLLYAMCYYKSPFDSVYERGDSVALAVLSGKFDSPEDSPYGQTMHDLIGFMLVVDASQRPFIEQVLEKVQELLNETQSRA